MKLPPLFLALLILFVSLQVCRAQQEQPQPEQPAYPTDQNGRWFIGRGEPLSFGGNISKEDITEVTSRWYKIDREDAAQNEWIGTYGVYGETHMTLLKWSPANGYVQISVNTCMAMIMSVEYGDAQIIGEQIFFYPKKSAGMTHEGGAAAAAGEMSNQNPAPFEKIPAKWRGVKYLLAEDEVKLFCDYVAGYGDREYDAFNGHSFFISGEEKGAPDELPIVPKRFENLIRKPISGKIISVGKRKINKIMGEDGEPYFVSETQVTINIGRADGVKEGMSFLMLNETVCCISDTVEVTKAGEKTSLGIITRETEDKPQTPASRRKDSENYAPLKIGWKITTSPHVLREYQQAAEAKNEQQQQQQQ